MTDSLQARKYQRMKQRISLFGLIWTPLILSSIVLSPLNLIFVDLAKKVHPFMFQLSIYFLLLSLWSTLFQAPLSYFSGFIIEHRFGLSNESKKDWLTDFLKKAILSFFISWILILGLYWFIHQYPKAWWLFAWASYLAVSYILGKIFPVFILPLFFKYVLNPDGVLGERIEKLCTRYGLPKTQVFGLNLSKKTKKANAAFMGIGGTKRVVLSDTLIQHFSHDEIETVVAHELGHYVHKDILKQLIFGAVTSFIAFFIVQALLDSLSFQFGYQGAQDYAAMPLLFILFSGIYLIMTPIQSAFSRKLEYAADRFSLEAYPNLAAFTSCMR